MRNAPVKTCAGGRVRSAQHRKTKRNETCIWDLPVVPRDRDNQVDTGRRGVSRESLIDSRLTDRFTVKRYRASAPFVLAEKSFFVMVVTHGQGIARCPPSGDSDPRPFRAYDRFFVPFASRAIEVAPEGVVEIAVILPPHA